MATTQIIVKFKNKNKKANVTTMHYDWHYLNELETSISKRDKHADNEKKVLGAM